MAACDLATFDEGEVNGSASVARQTAHVRESYGRGSLATSGRGEAQGSWRLRCEAGAVVDTLALPTGAPQPQFVQGGATPHDALLGYPNRANHSDLTRWLRALGRAPCACSGMFGAPCLLSGFSALHRGPLMFCARCLGGSWRPTAGGSRVFAI